MKFTVSLSAFQGALSKALPAIPRKSTLPVLEHLNFSLESNNLKLIATDQDITIMSKLEVNGESDGKVLVPARLLSEIIKALGTVGDIEFISEDDTYEIKIKTMNGKYDMKGLNPEEYLDLPELFESEKPELQDQVDDDNKTPAIFFGKEDIMKLANKTVFAVSNDEYRPAMNGVLFQFKDKAIHAVATDSFRLVKATVRSEKNSFPDDLDIIIPARAIDLLRKPEEDVVMSVIETAGKITHVRFDIGYTVYISRLIDERFPPYESVIPNNNDKKAVIPQSEILKAIKRVSIFTSDLSNQIRFKISDNNLTLLGEDEESGNKANENVHCDYDGEEFQIGFNYKFLEESIQNVETDEDEKFIMTFSEPTRPALIKPGNGSEDLLMLIMPVRLS